MEKRLQDTYLVLSLSFEAADDLFASAYTFTAGLVRRIGKKLKTREISAEISDTWNTPLSKDFSNLFFWDWDYGLFFATTFVEGIHMLESFAGEQSGYGYDEACSIFTDIGLKVPLRLVGTREATNFEKLIFRSNMLFNHLTSLHNCANLSALSKPINLLFSESHISA